MLYGCGNSVAVTDCTEYVVVSSWERMRVDGNWLLAWLAGDPVAC